MSSSAVMTSANNKRPKKPLPGRASRAASEARMEAMGDSHDQREAMGGGMTLIMHAYATASLLGLHSD
jgi:hypothetical protein